MNSIDFSILKLIRTIPILLSLLTGFASPVLADEPPALEKFIQRNELVLTLSDDSLASDNNQHATQSSRIKNNAANQSGNDTDKNQPINLGCGMDVSPFGSDSNSLSTRLVGECNLDYRY